MNRPLSLVIALTVCLSGTLFAQTTSPATRPALTLQFIPPGADLADVARNAAPCTLYLPPDPLWTYTLTGTARLTAEGAGIRAWGNPLVVRLRPGDGTGIELRGAGEEFGGFVVGDAPTGVTLVQVYGDSATIHDLTITTRVEQVCQLNGCASPLVARLKATVPTGSRLVFGIGTVTDAIVDGCVSVGSLGEDNYRFSADGDKAPARLRIVRCQGQTIPQVGKNSAIISVRECREWCYIEYNLFPVGWAFRGGQAGKRTVFGLHFNHNFCGLDSLHTDHYTLVNIMGGELVECEGNAVVLDEKQRFLGWDVSVSSVVAPSNTNVYLSAPGVRRKKLAIGSNAKGETDGTGTVIGQLPAPAMPPAPAQPVAPALPANPRP